MAKLNDFAKRLRDAPAKGVLEPPAAESSSNIPENQEEGDWLSGGGLKFSVDSARVRNKLKQNDLVFLCKLVAIIIAAFSLTKRFSLLFCNRFLHLPCRLMRSTLPRMQ